MPKKPARPTAERSPWAAATVAPEDLEVAKREALLQLRLGRAAHLAAIAVSAALALDAVLILLFARTLPVLANSQVGGVAAVHSFYLFLPIIAGLVVAGVTLAAKWESFQVWPWEGHFSVNVAAVGVAIAAAVLYGLRLGGSGSVGHVDLVPLLLPLGLAAASLALVGTAATWTPWGSHQWISAVTAGVAFLAGFVTLVPGFPLGSASEELAVALLVSAILYQTSGSFLHLTSSGTGPHEQAIVLGGQNRMVRIAGELQHREEAIRFREAALVKREAEAETADATLRRARELHADRTSQLTKREATQRTWAEKLAGHEREVVGREAALATEADAVHSREIEVQRRTQELSRLATELAAREQRIAKGEGDLARRDLESRQKAQDLQRRESTVSDGEGRILARRKEVEQKTADLLRREGEVTARERVALGPAPKSPSVVREVAAAGELAAREAQVTHLKQLLDEQNVQLGRRSKEVAEQAKALQGTLGQIGERQSHLVARESALSQREGDLEERLKAADERRLQFESAARDYQQRLDEIGKQQVSSAQRASDLDRQLQSATDRLREVEEREGRLRQGLEEVERREAEVTLRERSVDADEAEVSLRRQEIEREGDLPFAGLLAVAAADRADAGPSSARSSRGRRGRSAPAPGPGIVEAGLPTDAGTLAPQSGRKYADRLPTGTPRLDDLLLGGLPPKSHVALVGDAFVGKEVALYAFIGEGLKRGEPALLVTAGRSATEIAGNLGIVVPQFREYEQMGNVTWIDASGAGAVAGPHHLVPNNAEDRAELLTLLVQGAKMTEEGAKGSRFRVGFFGLSALMAHAEERASFSFLQNVVGILKPRDALAMYALEAGALGEAQVESLLGRMDGAILFKQERDRTFLSVKGFGDVATRDWVEVRATSRALVVGSFALERIR